VPQNLFLATAILNGLIWRDDSAPTLTTRGTIELPPTARLFRLHRVPVAGKNYHSASRRAVEPHEQAAGERGRPGRPGTSTACPSAVYVAKVGSASRYRTTTLAITVSRGMLTMIWGTVSDATASVEHSQDP
jgi:hypothetical protein